MISVIVQRSPGDRPGPDISEPLITSEVAAMERGRVEIDRNSTNREIVTAGGPYRQWLTPGALLAFHGRRGSWQGMVKRCGLTISREGEQFTATLSVEMEREP
jgi:hypothetical protein